MAIAGKVAPTYDGDWSASKSYQQHTYVRYNGDAYIAMKASVGIEPTNEEYWFLALKNVSQAQLDALNNRIDSIQTTSSGTLSEAGWYRVAEYQAEGSNTALGGNANSCTLEVKRTYSSDNNEVHILSLTSVRGNQSIVSNLSKSNKQLVTKARYTHETATHKAYLEIYYSGTAENYLLFEVTHGKDYRSVWQAITPTLTSETVDGVIVTTTYDIPSNASPVTDLDLANYLPKTGGTIGNSSQTKTYGLGMINALRNVVFQLLDSGAFRFYDVTNGESVFVSALDGTNTFNGTASGNLPLDGSKAMTGNLKITNTNGNMVLMTSTSGIGLMDLSTTKWILRKFGGKYYVDDDKEILHKGNSAPTVVSTSAPSDTSAVWYDTTNKVIKYYKDGAWQQ